MLRQGNMAAALTAAMIITALPAVAADAGEKRLSGGLSVEVENDHLYDAEDGSEGNDLFTKIEAAADLRLAGGLSLQTGLKFEPIQGPAFGEDRFFGDQGLIVDTLQLYYEGDGWFAHAGKFTPTFGLDQDAFPGIFGDTFSASYELVDRLGFGGGTSVVVPEFATLGLQAAVFKRDTTILSDSFASDRGRLRESAGGPGNTSGLESFGVAVHVTDFGAAPGLALRASALHQARGMGDTDDQWAFSLGGLYEIDLGDDTSITPLLDYVHSSDAIGVDTPTSIGGAAESYLTTGFEYVRGPWNGTVVGGLRWDSQPGLPDNEDGFLQISAGYQFANGIGIDVGWLYLDQTDVTTQAVGVRASYGLEF